MSPFLSRTRALSRPQVFPGHADDPVDRIRGWGRSRAESCFHIRFIGPLFFRAIMGHASTGASHPRKYQ